MTPPRFPRLLLLSLFPVFLFSCKEKKVTRAYYYWRNSTYVSDLEKSFLRQHAMQKLYAKCLDIDWNEVNQAHPLTITDVHEIAYALQTYDSMAIQVVPVIFITNKTFRHTDSADIPLLATRILRKCLPGFDGQAIPSEQWGRRMPIPLEIQFDCDWSATTKDKYFYFLQEVRRQLAGESIAITATVRLHQYKYPTKTGVPPVDRGMLMIYNVEKLTDYASTNSIFDYKKAKTYFTGNRPYPLPLDIALPAYSWGIIFRQGKFYQIENELNPDTLQQSAFLRNTRDNTWKVTADTVFYDVFLRPGDEIRLEKIDEQTLRQVAQLAGKAINTDSFTVTLFELSDAEIKNYQHETIEQVYNGFVH
jgi:hypothetical protein